MRVCSELSVLNFGQLIAHGTPEQVQSNAAVLDAYLGGGGGDADAVEQAAVDAGVNITDSSWPATGAPS
jgi:hypothetical protein